MRCGVQLRKTAHPVYEGGRVRDDLSRGLGFQCNSMSPFAIKMFTARFSRVGPGCTVKDIENKFPPPLLLFADRHLF